MNNQELFDDACRTGDIATVDNFIKNRSKIKFYVPYFTHGFVEAVAAGQLDIVNLCITNRIHNWNTGIYRASEKGHIEIVNRIIEMCATRANNSDLYNSGLIGACKGGQLGIAILMIGMGANIFNGGLVEACSNGNFDIAVLMIEMGANEFESPLRIATRKGCTDITNLLRDQIQRGPIQRGPIQRENWSNHAKMENEDDCPICLNKMTTKENLIRHDLCGKFFHASCANRWLLGSHKTCPLCRGFGSRNEM